MENNSVMLHAQVLLITLAHTIFLPDAAKAALLNNQRADIKFAIDDILRDEDHRPALCQGIKSEMIVIGGNFYPTTDGSMMTS